MHEGDLTSIEKKVELMQQTLNQFPLILKLPDAFCCMNELKLYRVRPEEHPVYGSIYNQTMNELFDQFVLGDREAFLDKIGLNRMKN